MIIYCAGPIKGDITFQKFYWEIINFVEEERHTPLAGLNTVNSPQICLQINKFIKEI